MQRRSIQLGLQSAALSSVLAFASTAVAQSDRKDDVDGWVGVVAALGQVSAVEPAGARGSMGYGIGAGMAVTPAEDGGRLAAIELDSARPDSGNRLTSPRAWFVKGTPLPIDVGFTGSVDPESRFSLAAAHMQWTIYESFARPALALRVGGARLFGLPHTTYSNESAELIAGYGFLRYFTVFASAGLVRHAIDLTLNPTDETAYLLAEENPDDVMTRDWRSTRQAAGLRVVVWPPFFTASAEAVIGDTRQYAAKLSFGM